MAWRRLSRPQSCRPHTSLEPGAADGAHAAGWPAIDARQPAPRRHAGRRRPGRAFLRDNTALAETEPSVHLDRDDHQFADGFRHSLDHDARRPGRGDDGAILAWLRHGLPVPAIRRRGEPPVFPHGAELPLGDRVFRGFQPAARSSASCPPRRSRTCSPLFLRRAFAPLRLLRPRSALTEFGAHCLLRSRARSAAAVLL